MLPGVYDIPTCYARVRAAFTNTLPVDAYRGAGRPEAAYVIERLVDVAARELGVGPDALRKKNFIKPKQMPYKTPTDKIYDFRRVRRAYGARAGSRRLGRFSQAPRGFAQGEETARHRPCDLYRGLRRRRARSSRCVNLEGDGSVKVVIGSQSTGQGHQTAYAQLVAEHLDLPPEKVTVIQGDTDSIPTGFGTGGSSSIPAGGASVSNASKKLADNIKKLAADALEAGTERSRNCRRPRARRRHRPRGQLCRSRRRRGAAGPAQDRGRLDAAADLSERHASRRSRDRSGHRPASTSSAMWSSTTSA